MSEAAVSQQVIARGDFEPPGVVTNLFSEISSLASLATATIVTFTVPVGKVYFLDLVEFSGDNISEYRVKIAATLEAKKCTYFGGKLTGEFLFNGISIPAGDVVLLEVFNFRGELADYAGRLLGRLDDV